MAMTPMNKTIITIAIPQFQLNNLIRREKDLIRKISKWLDDNQFNSAEAAQHVRYTKHLAIHQEMLRNFETALEQQGTDLGD